MNPLPHTPPARVFGLLPLLFVAAAAIQYASVDRMSEVLWLCNVGNLLLGAGLLLRWPRLVWVGTLWVLLGIPLWFLDIAVRQHANPHAFFTHIVASGLGLWALRRLPVSRWSWSIALGLGGVLQLVCRYLTPSQLNVNVAHAPYIAIERYFASYATYAAFNLAIVGLTLWGVELALVRLWVGAAKTE